MPRDLIEECALIEMSRIQRRSWEFLLLTAGLKPDEAERIADLAAEDRAEMSQQREAA